MKAFGKCAAAASIDIAPDRGLRAFLFRVDIVAAHERETERVSVWKWENKFFVR